MGDAAAGHKHIMLPSSTRRLNVFSAVNKTNRHREVFSFCHSLTKKNCKRAGGHIQTKTNYALRHYPPLCWRLAFTRNYWRETAGCLATKQMKKGLGDSYFPDD